MESSLVHTVITKGICDPTAENSEEGEGREEKNVAGYGYLVGGLKRSAEVLH